MIVMEERHTNVILIVGVICLLVLHETGASLLLKWNTTKPTEPFVMVRYNDGKWGEICAGLGTSTEFNDKAAHVTCRQMGFLDGKVHVRKVQANTSEIILDYVVCPTGEESSLIQCQYRPSNASSKCPFDLAIKVECIENPELNGLFDATLLGEKKAHEGILQVTNGGTDGEVCYDAITADAVGKVVCKQMGYSGVDSTAPVDSNSTIFYNASCPKGTEQTLAACTLTNSCSSKKVINVTCKLDKATQRRFDVRLSSSTNSMSEGTVEVYQYGRWGVICDTDWDIEDAEVVCRELGYTSVISSPTAATFGQGTGVVFWNNMQCNGNESSIAECDRKVALGTKMCDSANAAGVVCCGEKFNTIDICSNGSQSKALEAGVTMIQSEAQPKPFANSKGQTCFLNLTSRTNFTIYIYKKTFEENHVEYLSFISADRNETLYGDDSRQGPFEFSSRSLTIEFKTDTASGSGVINIMVSVAAPPPTPTATTTETNGMTVGIVIAVAITIVIIILVFVLWKKGIIGRKNRPRRNSAVVSYEKNIGGQGGGLDNKSGHNGGVVNKAFAIGTTNTSNFAAKLQGNGIIPGNGDAKEPETGETKRKTKLTRPASGSGIDVEIGRASTGLNAYESAVTGVPGYNPYQDVEEESNPPFNKPNTSMPVSGAYADVELGAPGEASKIHDQPKQEDPTKAEKKKKHGKDKKKPEKEKKKKWRKDKNKSKENLVEDAAHAPVGNDSCAVPMRDDFDMPPESEYAEVGARRGVGQINPACLPEQNDSETYDDLDFKGRKTAPHNPGNEATYDSVHRL